MAFGARAHWHGYLMVFAHGSILHPPKKITPGNCSNQLAVSMLEKKETISGALTWDFPSIFKHRSEALPSMSEHLPSLPSTFRHPVQSTDALNYSSNEAPGAAGSTT